MGTNKKPDVSKNDTSSLQRKVARLEGKVNSLNEELASLKILEKRFSILFNEAIDSLMVIDPVSGKIIQANRAALALLGYHKEEILGRHFSSIYPPESPVSKSGFPANVQIYGTVIVEPIMRSDGSECIADLTLTMISWENDQAILLSFRDATERVRAEQERERLILELKDAMEKIKTLRGMIPICSHCKKIRDDSGYWQQVEVFVRDHTEAQFSHGICPDCMRELYPDYCDDKE